MFPLLMLFALPAVKALVGYDCGGEGLNITTLSLLDIGESNQQKRKPTSS